MSGGRKAVGQETRHLVYLIIRPASTTVFTWVQSSWRGQTPSQVSATVSFAIFSQGKASHLTNPRAPQKGRPIYMQRERELNAVRHPSPTERACPLSKITQLTSGGHRISTQSLTPESVFSSTLPFHKTLLCFILKRLNFKTLRKVLVAHLCATL